MRPRHIVAWAAIGVTAALSTITAVAYAIPYDRVSASTWQVSDREVRPGDTVYLSNTFCSDGVQYSSVRFIVRPGVARSSGWTEFSPPVSDITGCRPARVPFLIPDDVPPGEWRAMYRTTYQANPIRSVTFETFSEPFTVLPVK